MSGSWRDSAAPRIAAVIKQHGFSDLKALRKALREAYPYGERKYHPYKIWCDEVRRQTGGRLYPSKRPAFVTRGMVASRCADTSDLFVATQSTNTAGEG